MFPTPSFHDAPFCQITFGNEQNREHITDADNGERSVTAGIDGPAPSAGMISMSILEDEIRRNSLGSVEAC